MPCSQLQTERLLLRPQTAADIPSLVSLLNDFEVAKNLARVPHPYTEDHARSFLVRGAEERAKGIAYPFAMIAKSDGTLIGGCGLHLKDDGVFELGYWIGRPFWGRGYASEGARRLAAFAFYDLKAARLSAGWFHGNPASGRVLEKLGGVFAGGEQRESLARGEAVYCYKVVLDRENFGRRQ
ncbi:MAG TPA: GNAT family N-acetyltransferase [Rhizomicrobium sp.]|nr:GNAT family N-acetyltransferase [Rhizomicrobium sp.]